MKLPLSYPQLIQDADARSLRQLISQMFSRVAVAFNNVDHETKTAAYSLLDADGTKSFDNIGAAGEVDYTLPPSQPGAYFEFTVHVAQTLKVIAAGSDTISLGIYTSAVGGNAASNQPYSSIFLKCHVRGKWVARCVTGQWIVT